MLLKCYSTGIRNDLDKANLVPGLSCPVLNSQGRNTAWFLTLNPHHWIVWTSNSWHSIKYSPKVTPEGHQLCAQERLILCVFDKLKIPKKHTKSDIPWYTPKLSHTKKTTVNRIYHGYTMDIPWISTNSNGYTMDISMGVFSDTSSPHLPSRTTRRVSCLTDVMLQLCQVLLISHFLLLAKSASLVLCIYSIFNSAKKMEIYEIGNQIYAYIYIYTYLNKIIYIYIHARNHKDIMHLQQPQLIILVSQIIYLESQKHMFLVIVAKNRNDHVFFL